MTKGAYYDWTANISTYYADGFSIATLNHDSEVFEDLEEMTEEDKDFYYTEMNNNRDEYLKQ